MANPLKPNLETEFIPVSIIIMSIVASFYFYALFPDRVPVHWDFSGNVNGWGSPFSAAFMIPIMLIGMYLLFLFMPLIDPKKERYGEFRRAYHIFKAVMIFFLALIYFIASLNALGYDLPIGAFVPAMVGLLFIVIGNYMGKFKLNWFIGIRNPWTLSNEEVWNKTNRLTGKIFMLGGLGLISEAFIPDIAKLPLFIIIICAIIIIPTIYSYILFRRINLAKK
jgi:uncharacterized membrane protein